MTAKKLEDSEVLEKNPRIDLERVKRYEAYVVRMSRAGVDMTPQYGLSSPMSAAASKSQR